MKDITKVTLDSTKRENARRMRKENSMAKKKSEDEKKAAGIESMSPTTGMCRFCQQDRFVVGAGKFKNQEEINEIATFECNCEEGESWRERQTSAKQAKDKLAEMFISETESHAAEMYLRPAIEDIAENRISSISITLTEKVSASVSMNGKGQIIVKRKEVEVDMVAV